MSLNLFFMILFHTYYHLECMYKIGNTNHNFWKKYRHMKLKNHWSCPHPFVHHFIIFLKICMLLFFFKTVNMLNRVHLPYYPLKYISKYLDF